MKVDFGRAALDYARHRAGFPGRFYDVLAAHGMVPGTGADRALDIATGTGAIARALAARGWRVDAIDLSADMLAAARMLAEEEGVALTLEAAPAESLPFDDRVFALATAGTCWHWFDRAKAAAEARRVLIPGGHLVIASLEWRCAPGNAIQATEDLIAAHNPDWAAQHGVGILAFDSAWGDELAGRGFTAIERIAFAVDIPYSHESWRGRIRASAGVGASLPPDGVAPIHADHAPQLAPALTPHPHPQPHQVQMIVARRA